VARLGRSRPIQTTVLRRRAAIVRPKIETLTDDFSGSLSKWPGSYGGVIIESGQAKIPNTSGYPGLWTNPNFFDLINSSVFAKITVPPGGSATRETSMEIRPNADQDWAMFLYTGDTIYFDTYTATVRTTWASIAYNATTMAYWRYTSTGEGNIRFSTSPDAVNWTEQANATVSWSVASVNFLVATGWYTTGPDAVVYVDNVNIAPTATGRPKVYVGGSFQSKPGKIWTGSAWVEKPWYRFDGTEWKLI